MRACPPRMLWPSVPLCTSATDYLNLGRYLGTVNAQQVVRAAYPQDRNGIIPSVELLVCAGVHNEACSAYSMRIERVVGRQVAWT